MIKTIILKLKTYLLVVFICCLNCSCTLESLFNNDDDFYETTTESCLEINLENDTVHPQVIVGATMVLNYTIASSCNAPFKIFNYEINNNFTEFRVLNINTNTSIPAQGTTFSVELAPKIKGTNSVNFIINTTIGTVNINQNYTAI